MIQEIMNRNGNGEWQFTNKDGTPLYYDSVPC